MDTLAKLMIYINNMDTGNLYYPILKAILKQPRDLPALTITELAERAAVSATAVSRFVKYAGFETFPQMKLALAMELSAEDSDKAAASAPQLAPYDPAQYLHELEIGLHALQTQLTIEVRRQLADSLHDANQAAFFMAISDAAMHLQRVLCLNGTLSVIIKGPNPMREFLFSMKPGDLLFVPIMSDWEWEHKIPIAEEAIARGIRVVLFSAHEPPDVKKYLATFSINDSSELVAKLQMDIIFEELLKAYLSSN